MDEILGRSGLDKGIGRAAGILPHLCEMCGSQIQMRASRPLYDTKGHGR